jgi:L-lactate dehydrogenase complex protein LldE
LFENGLLSPFSCPGQHKKGLVEKPMTNLPEPRSGSRPRVGLFVTCLVDLMRPSIGFAAVKLLQDAGCTVEVPLQTCCGQPAFNSGDRATAQALARRIIHDFADFDYVIAPSGSCAGMMVKHFPELFKDDPDYAAKADRFAARTYELISFLTDILKVTSVDTCFLRKVTLHDSCSGLRELGIESQPRQLLKSVRGLDLVEMEESTVCCGFGGTFAVKYEEISSVIADKKAAHIEASGAPVLLAGDLGCLMNMAGKLARRGSRVEARHIAEVLADMTDTPPIGRGVKP